MGDVLLATRHSRPGASVPEARRDVPPQGDPKNRSIPSGSEQTLVEISRFGQFDVPFDASVDVTEAHRAENQRLGGVRQN